MNNPIGGTVGPGQVISMTRRSAWRREYDMRAGERALGWLRWRPGRRSAAQAEGPGLGQSNWPPGAGESLSPGQVAKTCQSGAPPALPQISMGVAAGEVVAVMGPSGCGKSTPTIQPRLRRDIMHPMFKQLFLGTDDLAAEDDRRRRVRRRGQTRPTMIIRPAGNRENRPRP